MAETGSIRRPGRPAAGTLAVPEERSILQRGLEAFAELGYEAASAPELARRLGVSHNFINDRCGSKAAFRRAVTDAALREQFANLPEVDPSADDADQLRQMITGYYRSAADQPLIARHMLNELNRETERLDYLYEQHIAPQLHRMMAVIERLIASGRMARIPVDVLFFIVIPPIAGMIDMPLARRLGRPAPTSPDQLTATAETLADLVVNGLLATAAPAGADLR